MNRPSDHVVQVKKIASFEPREQSMNIQNNHPVTVCIFQTGKSSFFIIDYNEIEWFE